MFNVYTGLTVVIIVLGLVFRENHTRNPKFILLACLALFIVLGFRDCKTVGNDSRTSYRHEFQRMEQTDLNQLAPLTEPGANGAFHRFMKLVYDLSEGDYQIFIIICALTYMIPFTYVLYQYSCNPLQSILFFMGILQYTLHFSALKQSMAMGILLLAFDAIMKKKPVRYLFLVAVACLFHFPAIVFLPAYLITKIKIGRDYIVALLTLLVLTYLFRNRLLNLMLNVYDTQVFDSGMRFLANKVLLMIIITVGGIIVRLPDSEDSLYNKLLSLMGVAIVLQTFAGYNNTFERLADYYFQFVVFFIPLVFHENGELKSILRKDTLALVQESGAFLACAFSVWRFTHAVQNISAMIPYTFSFMK